MVRELVPHIGFRSKIFKKVEELKTFNATNSSFLKLVVSLDEQLNYKLQYNLDKSKTFIS